MHVSKVMYRKLLKSLNSQLISDLMQWADLIRKVEQNGDTRKLPFDSHGSL